VACVLTANTAADVRFRGSDRQSGEPLPWSPEARESMLLLWQTRTGGTSGMDHDQAQRAFRDGELMEALMELLRAQTLPELVLVWLVSAVGAAVSEEFVFRGVLQNSLVGWVRGWGAVVMEVKVEKV